MIQIIFMSVSFPIGHSYGQIVDWMDSSEEETAIWKDMIDKPNEWVEAILPLRSTMTKRK